MLVLVCRGPECGEKRDSASVQHALASELRAQGIGAAQATLAWQSCFGQCRKGVNVLVRELRPGEDAFFLSFKAGGARSALYHGVGVGDVARIVSQHVREGQPVTEFLERAPPPFGPTPPAA
jgi:(2Fe-2S) ferredoxin